MVWLVSSVGESEKVYCPAIHKVYCFRSLLPNQYNRGEGKFICSAQSIVNSPEIKAIDRCMAFYFNHVQCLDSNNNAYTEE